MRPALRNIFMRTPLPFSKWLYAIARRTVFPNGREPQFDLAFRNVRDSKVCGDYLEFGVYQGSSFILAADLAKKYDLNMRFFAFDSFEGLPHTEGRFTFGDYRCSQEDFVRSIVKAGVELDRVRVISGLYDDSLNNLTRQRYRLERAAVVHVDCDLYSSTKSVLDFVQDLLQTGTVLIFDDWGAFGQEEHPEAFGEQRAFQEWQLSNSFREFYDFPPAKAFIFV